LLFELFSDGDVHISGNYKQGSRSNIFH